MSKVTILSFLGWINEKKPLFNCVNERGREVVLQAATHPDDYSVGRAYHLADVDNENNPNKQRIIPELPTSRWYTAEELAQNLPWTLAKAYLYKDAYKNGVPGFRKDVIVGFNDNQVLLKDYGWASLYQDRLPKTYEGSIEAGDEVTVGFSGSTWGTPIAYAWTKRPELPLQQEGGIVEIIPNWIQISRVVTTEHPPNFEGDINTEKTFIGEMEFSIVGGSESQIIENIIDDQNNRVLWDISDGTPRPATVIIPTVINSNTRLKIKVNLTNGGFLGFGFNLLTFHSSLDDDWASPPGPSRYNLNLSASITRYVIITEFGTLDSDVMLAENGFVPFIVTRLAGYIAPTNISNQGTLNVDLDGDKTGRVDMLGKFVKPITARIEKKYIPFEVDELAKIGVSTDGLSEWVLDVDFNKLGVKQHAVVTTL